MKIKWQYHDPESSPGTVIIDKRALEGAGSDELAQLAKSQAIGATVGTAVGLTLPISWKVLSHPITQTVGTVTGLHNLATDQGVKKTVNHFKNKEIFPGIKSAIGDVLDMTPVISGVKAVKGAYNAVNAGAKVSDAAKTIWRSTDLGRWLSPETRAIHAYVTIPPSGYHDKIKRARKWLSSWLSDRKVDINNPEWDLADDAPILADYISRLGAGEEARKATAIAGREDAFRIYNRLPQKHGLFIKNDNGTYAYNFDKLSDMLGISKENLVHSFLGKPKWDYWTGAHGNLWTISDDIPIDEHNYIQHIEDMWDVNPFQRSKDKVGMKLAQKVNKAKNKWNNFAQRIIPDDWIYDMRRYSDDVRDMYDTTSPDMQEYIELPYKSDYAKNNWLYQISHIPSKRYENYPIFNWIDSKLSNFEMGMLTGGKPYKLEMDIPYHTRFRSWSPTEMPDIEYRIGLDPNYIYPKHKANVSKFMFNKSNIKNMNLTTK